jgi:RNA polymerase sigma-70 factor (ECF subfamily)
MQQEFSGTADPQAVLAGAVVSHEAYLRAFVRASLAPALRDQESVSDIVQSTIRQVLDTPGSFEYRSDAELRAYLRRAAHNKILNRIRKRGTGKHGVEPLPADPEALPERHDSRPGPPECALRSEELEALRAALDSLPEDEAELIRLNRILGLSLEAIAELRGEPASTLGSRIHRGITALAARMRPLL